MAGGRAALAAHRADDDGPALRLAPARIGRPRRLERALRQPPDRAGQRPRARDVAAPRRRCTRSWSSSCTGSARPRGGTAVWPAAAGGPRRHARHVRYNTGLHVSENGRGLARLLDEMVEEWPCQLEELVLIGHSMGGLVARSACHYGASWTDRVRHVFCLGSPHLGADLEKGANVLGSRWAGCRRRSRSRRRGTRAPRDQGSPLRRVRRRTGATRPPRVPARPLPGGPVPTGGELLLVSAGVDGRWGRWWAISGADDACVGRRNAAAGGSRSRSTRATSCWA